jgi:hypothetical protein
MAKQQTGTHRTTISVPLDLKKRMDKVKDPPNWSAIASEAFETKLAEIASQKEKKTMDDVIQRLRGSRIKHAGDAYYNGILAGKTWAKEIASAGELSRLERANDEQPAGWPEIKRTYSEEDCTPGVRLYAFIYPSDRGLKGSDNFWSRITGADTSLASEPPFVEGFIEGALDIWALVKSRV